VIESSKQFRFAAIPSVNLASWRRRPITQFTLAAMAASAILGPAIAQDRQLALIQPITLVDATAESSAATHFLASGC
jgi:hypothetical protein